MNGSNMARFGPVGFSVFMALAFVVASGCSRKPEPPVATEEPVSRVSERRVTRAVAPPARDPFPVASPAPVVPQSVSQDFEVLKANAEAGDLKAQTALGAYFATGQGGRINMPEAIRWYRAAAERGELHAQYQSWHHLFAGHGRDARRC